MEHSIKLYTDGACIGNPGPGGWGVRIEADETSIEEVSGGEPETTNNRMELMAVIEGLRRVPVGKMVTIFTDSKYVMDAFDKGWLRGWKQNGWRTASKSPVKNQDLWIELDPLVAKLKPKWIWVKGHSGIPGNERVDELAQIEARRQLDKAE